MEDYQPVTIKIYFAYSHEDKSMRDELETHITAFKRQYHLVSWFDRNILPGEEWEKSIAEHFLTSDVILLLISPHFMASDFCYSVYMRRAIEQHQAGVSRVIPILLRPTYVDKSLFKGIQILPSNGIPISRWPDRDEAFYEVVESIKSVCDEIFERRISSTIPTKKPSTSASVLAEHYELYEVFVKSRFPSVTFVEREDFGQLKLSLADSSRGVVIEGPSGVGKTTAVKKALEDLASSHRTKHGTSDTSRFVQVLSAREPDQDQLDLLETLPRWHHGTIIIDDFHRLDLRLRMKIVDYLKYLADTESDSKKLVIIGVPQSGQALINISFDVATRIDIFTWGKVKDELIFRMIEKGEKALNIEFDPKGEIALAASGSLNIAQYLCYYICAQEGTEKTQEQLRIVHCNLTDATSKVMVDSSRKFGESIRRFAAMGGDRDLTCLRLLEELAHCEEGFLSLPLLKVRKRELAQGIERFIREKWMDNLYTEYPASMNLLFFDQTVQALVADDPQLMFYLNKVQFSSIEKEAGKLVSLARQKIFVSYSHKDTDWLERLRVHLKPLERRGVIDLWDDTKISAGKQWIEEIQSAIDSSAIAVVLVSADFLASDFISEYELPKLLLRANTGGTTILSVVVSPCLFVGSGLDIFQAVNSPDRPLAAMKSAERERTLVNLAEIISKKLIEAAS